MLDDSPRRRVRAPADTEREPQSVVSDLGFRFVLDLSDAVGRTTCELRARDPVAFVHRDADLVYAVERELYFSLVNNPRLQTGYEVAARGGAPIPVTVANQLECEVVRRLLPFAHVEHSAGAVRSGVRREVQEVRNALGRLRRRRLLAGRVDIRGRSAVFLLHHPKFLRFLEPVLRHLDSSDVLVVWTSHDLVQHAGGLGLTAVSVFEEKGREPLPEYLAGANAPWAYDSLARVFAVVEPRTVVVLEGNNPWDEVASRLARATGMRSLCIQHGWSPLVHTGFRNMSFSSMLVWGAGFADLLAPYNPEQRFTVSGNPMFGASQPAQAEDRGPCVAFFLQTVSPLLSPRHVEDLYALVEELARRRPDVRILVREHPGAPISADVAARLLASPRVTLVPAEQVPLQDVLREADATLSIYSTTILESVAALTPPVVYNTTSLPRYSPDVAGAGAGVEVTGREEALQVLDRLLSDAGYRRSFEPAMQAFRSRFFSDEADPAARIAALISGDD